VEAARQSVQASRFTVKSAEAALKEAEKNLTKTEIYSPVNGTISRLNFEKGERVVGTMQMQGSEIMTIADLDEMEVTVEVNENDIIRVGYNDTCDIEVDAYLDEDFTGIVTNIANSAMSEGMGTDQITNFEVKVRILRSSYADLVNEKQPDQSPFRPGMSATVDIRTRQVKDVLTVPIQAVTTRSEKDLEKKEDKEDRPKKGKRKRGRSSKDSSAENSDEIAEDAVEVVFVISEGETMPIKVEAGIQNNEFIEITSGLSLGDKVVTAPYRAISKKLKAGDEVEEVSEDDLYGGEDESSDE
ncbi:MAG: efflux RND transporter periplasmic adaptor subunit, partial [Flavobacteriales bacterium]|nr:efflux RND transporter periplasmic adaptor subunit [Flavobacteriales bacterium]